MSSVAVVGATPPALPLVPGVVGGAALTRTNRDRMLPVADGLTGLFPGGGLRRGSTVVVRGSTTVLLSLLAAASERGSWAAVVGMPELGVLAAAELGVTVSRLAVVPRPGAQLGAVVAALLDGVDLVVVAPGLAPQLARRLSARARNRGAVLLATTRWPAADLELTCVPERWDGLDLGYGRLRSQHLRVHATGRGAAARPVTAHLRYTAGVLHRLDSGAGESPGAGSGGGTDELVSLAHQETGSAGRGPR